MGTRPGAAGGRANEVGSNYRAYFAAYVAAYGLGDRDVWFDEARAGPGRPEFIWTENGADVDDLTVEFSSGSRWDIQATSHCSWDAKLRASALQWANAVRAGGLGPDDRVALAAGKLSAPVRYLRDALRRVQEQGTPLPREQTALDRLRSEARTAGWEDVYDEVADRAVIVELDCAGETSAGFRQAAELLDGTIVGNGHGGAALAAAKNFLHAEASRSGASRPDRWLRAIEEASVPVGPTHPNAERAAVLRVHEYRTRLASKLDLLPLNFLQVGVEPLPVENLLDRFRVNLDTDGDDGIGGGGLADVARRWAGLCLLGAAGSGKSTAMVQLAAAWATDPDAPVPIFVPMHRLIDPLRAGEPVDAAFVVSCGQAVDDEVASLLLDRLRAGRAALLLDGLDECRSQQDAAAGVIRDLRRDLPAGTGIVVSAREAIATTAASTGLPSATLNEPHHLTSVADDILVQVMNATRPDHVPRELAQARTWMRRSQEDHPDMWKVPLFSTLLAAHVGRTSSEALPETRAAALVAAINDSVKSWEAVYKHEEPQAWRKEMTAQQLLDGFAALGHATASGSASGVAASEAIEDMLRRGWKMAPPEASETAEAVISWWVGRVGTFTDRDGEIRPALRLFGEIGDALWVSKQPIDIGQAWMRTALTEVKDRREPILLAASLSPGLANVLFEEATTADSTLLAADAVHAGIAASDAQVDAIAGRLRDFDNPPRAGDESEVELIARAKRSQAAHDGPHWPFRLALVRLPDRGSVARIKQDAMDREAEEERALVLGALAVTSACAQEGRSPSTDEERILEGLIDLPVPQKDPPPTHKSRRHIIFSASPRIVSGRIDALTAAIPHIAITEQQARAAVDLVGRAPWGSSWKLSQVIRGAGFDELLEKEGPFARFAEIAKSMSSMWTGSGAAMKFILERAAESSSGSVPEASWRLENITAIIELLNVADLGVGDLEHAVAIAPDLVTNLAHLATGSPEVERGALAAEAAVAQQIIEGYPIDGHLLLYLDRDPTRPKPTWPSPTVADLPWLRQSLRVPSDWLNTMAAVLLSNMADFEGDALLLDELESVTPSFRRRLAQALLSDLSTPDLEDRWLSHSDALIRVAATEVWAGKSPDVAKIAALAGDPDLSVRIAVLRGTASRPAAEPFESAAANADQADPAFWTCPDCGHQQLMPAFDCKDCKRGSRTEVRSEIESQRKKR